MSYMVYTEYRYNGDCTRIWTKVDSLQAALDYVNSRLDSELWAVEVYELGPQVKITKARKEIPQPSKVEERYELG